MCSTQNKKTPQVIKKPLFFHTIESRLATGYYPSPDMFSKDVLLVFSNCKKFTAPARDKYYHAGKKVRSAASVRDGPARPEI